MTLESINTVRIYKRILLLGLPIMIGQLGVIILTFADAIMVGHYSTQALAAASFVNGTFNLLIVVLTGYSIGLTPSIGSNFATGNTERVGQAMRCGIRLNLLFGLLITTLALLFYINVEHFGQPESLLPQIKEYMLISIFGIPFVALSNAMRQFFDGIGNTAISMWVTITGNVMNILGNWLLIFGVWGFPELGLAGAGLSTLISRIYMATALCLIYAYNKKYKSYFQATLHSPFNRTLSQTIHKTSYPVSIQIGLETSCWAVVSIMMGWLGELELAAYNIMASIGTLGFLIYYSFGNSMAIVESHAIGLGNITMVKRSVRSGYGIILFFTAIACLIFYFGCETLIAIFTDDIDVRLMAASFTIPLILYQFCDATQITFANALRGISAVEHLSVSALVAYIICGIPAAYILGFTLGFGAVGIFYSFSIGLGLASLFYSLLYIKAIKLKDYEQQSNKAI